MSAPRVDLVFVDSGGGHRAAAVALRDAIARRGLDWDLELVSLQEVLDDIDVVRKVTGIPGQDLYNILLRRGWTLGSSYMIRAMHAIIRLFHREQIKAFGRYWVKRRPDLVVSLVPHFNRALKQSLASACPGAPLVTILTDIADYPPHFWIETQEQFVVCGSARAEAQARMSGLGARQILRSSGMIVHPRFYERPAVDRREARRLLGLDPDLPLGLVLFGGEGSTELVSLARDLNRHESGTQLIVVCGKHEEAQRRLAAMPRRIPMRVEGFSRQVPFYMDLADYFIGKPGPGAISEALVKRLPVLVRSDRWTLAHERYNCDWIQEHGVGVVIRERQSWLEGARAVLAEPDYTRYRENAAKIENRAVFEIPGMLDRILSASARRPAEPAYIV